MNFFQVTLNTKYKRDDTSRNASDRLMFRDMTYNEWINLLFLGKPGLGFSQDEFNQLLDKRFKSREIKSIKMFNKCLINDHISDFITDNLRNFDIKKELKANFKTESLDILEYFSERANELMRFSYSDILLLLDLVSSKNPELVMVPFKLEFVPHVADEAMSIRVLVSFNLSVKESDDKQYEVCLEIHENEELLYMKSLLSCYYNSFMKWRLTVKDRSEIEIIPYAALSKLSLLCFVCGILKQVPDTRLLTIAMMRPNLRNLGFLSSDSVDIRISDNVISKYAKGAAITVNSFVLNQKVVSNVKMLMADGNTSIIRSAVVFSNFRSERVNVCESVSLSLGLDD